MHPHVRRPTPGARAFGSARGLLRQRCGLSSFLLTLPPLKSNSGGWEHAAQAAATAAPPPSNHTGPLCVEWQIWTCKQLFIYVYKMERCVCGCVYDPRCQIKNNAGKKKKEQKIFSPRGHYFLHWTPRISEAAGRNPPCTAPLTHSCRRSLLLPTLHTAVLPFCSSRSHFTATAATSPRQR